MSLAYMMINTVPEKVEAVLEELREIEAVKEAYMVYGVYDIITKVKAGNVEELNDMILNIRRLNHISSTLTLLVIS
jgi:DNA-binding Lrp family transcriptional regulator